MSEQTLQAVAGFTLVTADLARLVQFYRDVLGFAGLCCMDHRGVGRAPSASTPTRSLATWSVTSSTSAAATSRRLLIACPPRRRRAKFPGTGAMSDDEDDGERGEEQKIDKGVPGNAENNEVGAPDEDDGESDDITKAA